MWNLRELINFLWVYVVSLRILLAVLRDVKLLPRNCRHRKTCVKETYFFVEFFNLFPSVSRLLAPSISSLAPSSPQGAVRWDTLGTRLGILKFQFSDNLMRRENSNKEWRGKHLKFWTIDYGVFERMIDLPVSPISSYNKLHIFSVLTKLKKFKVWNKQLISLWCWFLLCILSVISERELKNDLLVAEKLPVEFDILFPFQDASEIVFCFTITEICRKKTFST